MPDILDLASDIARKFATFKIAAQRMDDDEFNAKGQELAGALVELNNNVYQELKALRNARAVSAAETAV